MLCILCATVVGTSYSSVCNLCVCTDEEHHVLLWSMYPHGPPVSVCVAPGSWAGSSAPRCRWPPSASPGALCGRCPPLCRSPPWWCRPRAADLAGRSCPRGGSWQSPARHSLPEMSLPMQTDIVQISEILQYRQSSAQNDMSDQGSAFLFF